MRTETEIESKLVRGRVTSTIRGRAKRFGGRARALLLLLVLGLGTTGPGWFDRYQGAAAQPVVAGSQAPAVDRLIALMRDPVADRGYGASPNVMPKPSGAVGVNRDFDDGRLAEPMIEEQRAGGDLVQLGLLRGRPDWRDRGWRAIEYAFRLQQPDGSFEGRRDRLHGATMFIEGAARAVVLERRLGDSATALAFGDDVLRTVRWILARDFQKDPEIISNGRFTHRYWIMAAALAEAAQIDRQGAPAMLAVAALQARRAMAAQQDDGAFPELGGIDVGYHATGMVYAGRYAALCPDPALATAVATSVGRGGDWLGKRVLDTGDIDPSGSTRILHERGRTGRLKGIPYGLIVQAFSAAHILTGQSGFVELGERVLRSPGFADYYRPSAPVRVRAD